MFLHVINAEYIQDYIIKLDFNDNSSGNVDLSSQIYGEIFEPLKDKTYFANFHIERYTLSWDNGADFAPEFLKSLLQN